MKAWLCCAMLAIFAAACSGQSQTSSTTAPTTAPAGGAMNTMAPAGGAGAMTIQIKALNGSGESGTATLTSMGAKTRVVLDIKGEKMTGKQPAHIHKGTCAKLDPKPAYPLHDVVLGKSSTVVEVALDKLTATPMAINVHESAANIGKYVACGNIH